MNIDHGKFTVAMGKCVFCGEIRSCVQIAPGFYMCGEALATALQDLTGWRVLNIYRMWGAQSALRLPDPRGVRDITPGRKKRK
jgi:hypothetical protein